MCGGNHYGCSNFGVCSSSGYGGSGASGAPNYNPASFGYSSGSGGAYSGMSLDSMVSYSAQGSYTPSPAISEYRADTAPRHLAAEPRCIEYRIVDPLRYSAGLYLQNRTSQYYFNPGRFLAKERETASEVNDAGEVMEFVREAFRQTTGHEFPEEFIRIKVCSSAELKKAHSRFGGQSSDSIMGFAINRMPRPSDIFVLRDRLDSLMLTIGHEIGHCISPTLMNARDEEAKAFAFSMAWMQAIKDNNIAGIGKSIRIKHAPAKNNIHDKAFEFVQGLLAEGREAMEIFNNISRAYLSSQAKVDRYSS